MQQPMRELGRLLDACRHVAEALAPNGYEYASVVIHLRDGVPDVVLPVLPRPLTSIDVKTTPPADPAAEVLERPR
jgi:hypothetical protein